VASILITGSPAGLSRVNGDRLVVLKHETSTTYQSHIYESIDLKFGYGAYVTGFSNPAAKFDEDRFSGGAPTWW